MKILLYNYVQPDERNHPGGGVSIYLANLLTDLRAFGHDVYTMSSGDRYELFLRRPRARFDFEKKQILIYNSPVVAPGEYSFRHPDIYVNSSALNAIPEIIRASLGSFDVFHFHNIEGLTKDFFYSLRRVNPQAAITYSAHNYSTVCAEVSLWKNYNESCKDFENGFACTSCLSGKDRRASRLLGNRIKTKFKDMESNEGAIKRIAYRMDKFFSRKRAPPSGGGSVPALSSTPSATSSWTHKADDYRLYRKANVDLINELFDRTVAVSTRTKEILVSYGANPEKVDVSYIGTRHYSKFATQIKKIPSPSNLHIAYIGYMRRIKGFYYFLDSIERLPSEILSQIDITLAAKFTDASAVQRIERLRGVARSLNTFDGYTQQSIGEILAPVNLGIVPPLWEDNLPQVAIEFVCHGIPILTSTRGGAREIANNEGFSFDVSDEDGLIKTLMGVVKGEVDLGAFWNGSFNLRSTTSHASEMQEMYASVTSARHRV